MFRPKHLASVRSALGKDHSVHLQSSNIDHDVVCWKIVLQVHEHMETGQEFFELTSTLPMVLSPKETNPAVATAIQANIETEVE